MIELFEWIWEMGGEVFLPDNLLISLHMVESETGSFIPETNWIQDRFLAERIWNLTLARSFLYGIKSS